MTEAPATWSVPDLGERVADTRFGHIRWFSTLDSTNRYLLEEARGGADAGLVVVADHQEAGRGRLGRVWQSTPDASLLVSVLVRPLTTVARVHLVTVAAAVAMAEAVGRVAGFEPSIKWPNDLVVGDRKLAGVLAEAELGGGEVRAVVVGIGVNVNWEQFPSELGGLATSCSLESGRVVDRRELLAEYLVRFDATLDDVDAAATSYRRRLATLGRRVRVELPSGTLEGVAVDVDHFGQLLVETGPGCIEEIAAGDVVHLRTTH
jgi:BirA family biotin operon repressor/biotin-[acetyl-CoA-carboxylase] ligase